MSDQTMSRGRDGRETRDSRTALLDAAAEEFARFGPQGARVQAVVKRAGVNERMIYHYFGSKNGLYAAVLDAELLRLAELWFPVLDESAKLEPYEGMHRSLSGFFNTLMDRPLLTALWVQEALAGWQTQPLPTADMLPPQLRELYERGQAAGVFKTACPFEVAYSTAIGALVALPIVAPRFADVLKAGPGDDSAQLRDQVVGLLLDGMTG
jgi:AcrR family transcriptional regulator